MTSVIRASEIGEYVYCRRAWWLRAVQGHASANVREMAEGTAAHAGHGQQVAAVGGLRVAALIVIALAVAVLVFGGQ